MRDYLANYGVDLRQQFQDDHQALAYLAAQTRQAQQLQQLAPYAQQYMQHADQFQRWQREQQEAQARQQQQSQQWWKAPDYDARWQHLLTRDPQTGELRTVPGAPPDTVQKYTAWVEHQRSFLDNFSRDPIQAIRPGIEQVVQETAQRLIQQQLGQYQEQTAAQQVLSRHSDWIYAQDPNTGQRVVTPLGRRYHEYVVEAERQMGVMDTARQDRYALAMLQRDYLIEQFQAQGQAAQQQAPVQDPNSAARARFLQQAANGQAAGQPAPTSPPPGNTQGTYVPAASGPRALQAMLARNLQAAGFGPEDTLVR